MILYPCDYPAKIGAQVMKIHLEIPRNTNNNNYICPVRLYNSNTDVDE